MLNEVNVKIKLVRSKDVFCVMYQADCKVMTTKAAMFVRKVKLSPSVFLAHAKALENGTAKYPIRRVVCNGLITIAIRVRLERDSSTIQHPTRSYVLSSNNEHVNSFALL